MQPILEIKGISKKFNIVHEIQPYLSLRDSVASVFRRNSATSEEFVALDHVSFNVMPGESIGIIGKNGAGKSTLLKILSKITPPSSGKITVRGRIASLLEVGTGFHPELTGRENVYLNGAILGMKRKEIDSKFDEIIDFSGTEQFLDTPLKHYSSGMQLRLAFAVAAFLEPEILVIDEVLAVGDAEFQRKCTGKMKDVTNSGRTILFVSHNLSLVKQLCSKVVVLKDGKVYKEGEPSEMIKAYLNIHEFDEPTWNIKQPEKYPKGYVASISILSKEGLLLSEYHRDEEIVVELQLQLLVPHDKWSISVDFIKEGEIVFRSRDSDLITQEGRKEWKAGKYKARLHIPANFLNYGEYVVNPSLSLFGIEYTFGFDEAKVKFSVTKEKKTDDRLVTLDERSQPGLVFPAFQWSIDP
jgi:lipopolysaccharide transport system ATP-binding protein